MKRILTIALTVLTLMSFLFLSILEESIQLSLLTNAYKNNQFHRVVYHLQNNFIGRYPDNAHAWLLLGHAQNKIKKYSESIISYNNAIALDKNLERAYLGLGIAYRNMGKYNLALSHYIKTINMNSLCAEAYSGLTIIELKNKHYINATKYALKSYELENKSPIAAANLSLCYHYINDIKNRDMLLHKAIKNGYEEKHKIEKLYNKKLFALQK